MFRFHQHDLQLGGGVDVDDLVAAAGRSFTLLLRLVHPAGGVVDDIILLVVILIIVKLFVRRDSHHIFKFRKYTHFDNSFS